MAHVDDLTTIAQDYLKVIWSAVEWGDPPITTKGLATRLGTTQANVSDTVKRLAAQGLLTYAPYRPVALTDLGERLARSMVRRHRLIETFLTEVLHYGWEEVHDDAELLEHAASEVFLARIDALLGHPRRDPHGDAIPDADGAWTRLIAPPLANAGPGVHVVARVADDDPDQLARLGDLGVEPGTVLTVDAEGAVHTVGSLLALHADDWAAVRVLPEGPRFAWGEPDADVLLADLFTDSHPAVSIAHEGEFTLVGAAPHGRLGVSLERGDASPPTGFRSVQEWTRVEAHRTATGEGLSGEVRPDDTARWGVLDLGADLVASWCWLP